MKEISGRKIILVTTVSTYCLCIIGSVVLTVMKLLSVDVFLALFGGLSGVVVLIVNSYFDRRDRSTATETNGGTK